MEQDTARRAIEQRKECQTRKRRLSEPDGNRRAAKLTRSPLDKQARGYCTKG